MMNIFKAQDVNQILKERNSEFLINGEKKDKVQNIINHFKSGDSKFIECISKKMVECTSKQGDFGLWRRPNSIMG